MLLGSLRHIHNIKSANRHSRNSIILWAPNVSLTQLNSTLDKTLFQIKYIKHIYTQKWCVKQPMNYSNKLAVFKYIRMPCMCMISNMKALISLTRSNCFYQCLYETYFPSRVNMLNKYVYCLRVAYVFSVLL